MNTYDQLKNDLDWHSRDWQTLALPHLTGENTRIRFKLDSDEVSHLGGRIRTETTIKDDRHYGALGDRVLKVYKGKKLLLTAAVENCGWGTKKVFMLMRLLGFNA